MYNYNNFYLNYLHFFSNYLHFHMGLLNIILLVCTITKWSEFCLFTVAKPILSSFLNGESYRSEIKKKCFEDIGGLHDIIWLPACTHPRFITSIGNLPTSFDSFYTEQIDDLSQLSQYFNEIIWGAFNNRCSHIGGTKLTKM